MRTLIGGIGYGNLSDLSFGPLLIERLEKQSWPDGVEVEDLSYGPVFIMHSLDEREPFDRMILIAAVARGGEPGEIRQYRWTSQLPHRDEVQARVVEAVTGVISLENLLVVTSWFGKLAPDVVVIEVEPLHEEFGQTLSEELESALDSVTVEVQRLLTRSEIELPRYDYIIADEDDRPRGWVVRPASPS